MRNVIVILEAGAIDPAKEICASLADYEVYLFDPLLGDPAAVASLRNVRLFSACGGPAYHTMDREAHADAFAWEAEIDAAQRSTGTGMSIAGWQHLNLYYVLLTMRWYSGLWDRMTDHFREGELHLFINRNPAEYYLPSFLPTLLLLTHLRRHGIYFKAYDYGAPDAVVYSIPDLPNLAPPQTGECLLTHLPTSLYDIAYFDSEIQATGRTVINIDARRWNSPVQARFPIGLRNADDVAAGLPAPLKAQVDAFTRAVTLTLARLLDGHIAHEDFRAQQVDHLTRLFRAQFITFHELERYFRDAAPAGALLSEHDAGFHGPLLAFAERRSIPVMLVPHSKVCADLEFTYDRIEVLTHPIQGRPVQDALGRPVANRLLSYPERFITTSGAGRGLRIVSLMLNAVSLNGIPFAPCDVYLDGIRRIVDWCRGHGVVLKIRGKPGHTITGLLSVYLGVDAQSLSKHACESLDVHLGDCDLCLMYDLATTGALFPLRNSVPTLNPLVTQQTPAQLAVVHADVIPPESVEQTLCRMDCFRADPAALDRFKAVQFRAYIDRFLEARPLRSYL